MNIKIKMKHIEIPEELHDLISFYSFVHRIPIKEFVSFELSNCQKLKDFQKKRQILKKLRT